MSLVVNQELAERLENAEIDTVKSRLTEMQKMDGNPMEVDIQHFGNATAFSVKNIPGPSYNTVKGLKAGDEDQVEKVIDFYKKKEIPVRFELTPAHTSTKLLSYLSDAGFYHHDFHSTLYAPILNFRQNNKELKEKITIRKLERHEFDIFADIYINSFQMPQFLKNAVAQNNEVLCNHKNWMFYLASYDGEPAGIGVLHIDHGVATLAAAATIPGLRNKGIQSDLIKQRILQAYKQHCDLIAGHAKFGSTSQNNMERAGLKIAYTKAIWIER
ncbi:GNAT family N-acetyltransferase [Evansella cellulosilytica]|uniref:GNAT family N-acetyltransferase n=1 Tax=Evansella cellulosilytica TaxID=1413 RepID=UPI00059FA509|nr:GNAT family N-acetyltransferase [Evansella cellulosilytica]